MANTRNISRRNFIAKGVNPASSLAIGTNFMVNEKYHEVAEDFSTSDRDDRLIDPIIPVEFFPGQEKKMLSYLIDLRKRYGLRRFVLIGPSKEFRYTGFPGEHVFRALGDQVLSAKKQLAPHDIEMGWWCTTTIRIGKGPFQSIIKIDGSVVNEGCCPLDPHYRKAFSDRVGIVVETAKPFLVNFEDDYHLCEGCYCPLHLAEFAKRQSRFYSRGELQRIFQERSPEAIRLKQDYARLKVDSLEQLASSVREKVDTIAPATRLCLCQSYSSYRDGNFTEAVTLAFAGKTRPAVRLAGTSYFSDDPLNIPANVFNCLYMRQHLPENVELIHESDSFPHTRFFMSSSKLASFMTAAFVYGFDDSLFYATQYLENPLEENGYLNMYLKERRRFSALKRVAKDGIIEGCEIFESPGTRSGWVHVVGRLGIPYTSTNGNVKLVSGDIVEYMTDGEIRELLQANVFLDGYSAYVLCSRGYGSLIGTEVMSREETVLPPFFESIRHFENRGNISNRLMYNYVWAFNSGNKDAFYRLSPHTDATVITDFVNSKNEPLYPGLIQFKNALGGRIAVMAFDLGDRYVYTRAISLFNYSRKALMRQTIEWLGSEPLPVFVKQLPNIFCIFSRLKSADSAIVVLTSLGADLHHSFTLKMAPRWNGAGCQLLNARGKWEPVDAEFSDNTITIRTTLALMCPVILRLEGKSKNKLNLKG